MNYRPRVTLADIAFRHRWRIQNRRSVRRGGERVARSRRRDFQNLSS